VNKNHGHEFEPSEAGKEVVQGNIQGGKSKKHLWKTHSRKGGKRVDVVECHLKDNTIEYSNSFPLGFALVKDVIVPMDRFKREPLEIM
jgi:hypothetical protein